MKFIPLLIFLCLLNMHSRAGGLAHTQVSKFTFDTIIPAPTLEDRIKTKDSELAGIQNHINGLIFREKIAKNADILRVLPESGSLRGGPAGETALKGYDEFLLSSRRLGDRKNESDALKAYGNFYALSGDLDKSISFYKEALSIKEELKDKNEIIKTNHKLGTIAKHNRQYDEAINFYENAIKTASGIKSTSLLPQLYLEIALIKTLQVKNGEAEYLVLKKALPLFTRQGNRQGRINSFQALAGIYHQQNRYSEAKWFYIQANTLARKLGDKNSIISSLINLARIKYVQGQYPLALKDYKEAEILASKNKNLGKLVEVKSGLGDLYYKMGNLIAANKEIDEYTQLKTTILNSGNTPLARK